MTNRPLQKQPLDAAISEAINSGDTPERIQERLTQIVTEAARAADLSIGPDTPILCDAFMRTAPAPGKDGISGKPTWFIPLRDEHGRAVEFAVFHEDFMGRDWQYRDHYCNVPDPDASVHHVQVWDEGQKFVQGVKARLGPEYLAEYVASGKGGKYTALRLVFV